MGIFLTFVNLFNKMNMFHFNDYPLKLIFATSIFGAVIAPILYFSGLKLTNASLASILINAEFLFTIIFAMSILREKHTKMVYIGIILIFAGLIFLNLPKNIVLDLNSFENVNFIGNMLVISATVFWALDNNFSKIILQKDTPIVTLIQLKSLIGGTISLLLVIWLNISFSITIHQIPTLLFLSLGGFAGSLFLFLKGIKKVGTIKSTMIFSSSSLFGIIFATIFLNEQLDIIRVTLSAMWIICGIYCITKNS